MKKLLYLLLFIFFLYVFFVATFLEKSNDGYWISWFNNKIIDIKNTLLWIEVKQKYNETYSWAIEIKNTIQDKANQAKDKINNIRETLSWAEDTVNDLKDTFDQTMELIDSWKQIIWESQEKLNKIRDTISNWSWITNSWELQ